jgi:glucose-6-phosphate 1-dehydrogenase
MVPSHLFQLLSLTAMEPPVSFSAEYLQDEKEKVLHTIQMLTKEQVMQQVVRGQYGPNKIDSKDVLGYRSEKDVSPQSATETYVALKLYVDNWRWMNVPFYLRTGKRMKARSSEIIIQFKCAPATLFSGCGKKIMPNILRIRIQPEESISLYFGAKIPGPIVQLDQVEMSFKYKDHFGVEAVTGYETLLYDCMNGDHTLFNRAEMVEAGWALVQPILDVWSSLDPNEIPNYPSGTWGPKEADDLLAKDGRKWIV